MGNGDDPDNDSAGTVPDFAQASLQTGHTQAPSEHEVANCHNEQVEKNIKQFISVCFKTVDWVDKHNGVFLAAATIAIAVLTWFLASDSYGQLDAIREQLTEIRANGARNDALIQINKDLATAAKNQAAAAKDQVAAMQGQLNETRIGDRAWIAPSNAVLRKELSISNDLVMRINFANSGHQPAFDFANSLRPMWVDSPKPIGLDNIVHCGQLAILNRPALQFEQMCDGVHVRHGAIVVFPNSASALDSPALSDLHIVDAVKRGDITFGVVGCVAYIALDHERHSSFCFYLQPIPGLPNDQWDIRTCPAGNYAD